MFPMKNLACKELTLEMTKRDKQLLVFHEEGFQPPSLSQFQKMIENKTAHKIIPGQLE